MKKIVLVLLFFISIGYAALSTTIDIKSNASLSFKNEDFKVYINNLFVDNVQRLADISEDGQTFTYNGNGNNEIEYTITNESYQYDVNVNLVCSNSDEVNFNQTNNLLAQSKKSEKMNLSVQGLIKCDLVVKKVERTQVADDACLYDLNQEWNFTYTGGEQKFPILCSGVYKLETWGASGGEIEYSRGSYGGYSVGFTNIDKGSLLYINVGGEGTTEKALTLTNNTYVISRAIASSYNGGGGSFSNISDQQLASGGGATHIATISGELSSLEQYKDTAGENSSNEILIVAGGGGATSCWNVSENNWWCKYKGGSHSGGGFKTNQEIYITSGDYTDNWTTVEGASQSSGFSFGKADTNSSPSSSPMVGGGGGWYGGLSSHVSGTGGSGYINSPKLISYGEVNKHMTCYECETSEQEGIRTISSNNSSMNAISDYAKKGNGYAKITFIGELK